MFGLHPGKKKAAPAAAAPGLGLRARTSRGAAIAQAQNQAPDSIPGMFKPGEFVLPPDTVHAMGGPDALKAVVDATHTPVNTEPVIPPGFRPEVFFEHGGRPEDQISPRNIYPQGHPSAGANVYGRARQAPAPTAPPPAAPVKRSEALAVQLQGLPAPQFQRDLVQRQALEGQIQRAQANERYDAAGAQMAAEARAAAAMRMSRAANRPLAAPTLPPSTGEAALAAHDAGSAGAGRGLVGLLAVSPASAPPAAAPSPAASVGAAMGSSAAASQPGSHEYGPPGSAAPTQVVPGAYRRSSSYADSAQAAAMGDQTSVDPSAGDNAAATNLAAQYAAGGFTPAMRGQQAPQQGSMGQALRSDPVRHSGNDWQARKDLANLETGASSIMNRGSYANAGMGRFRGGGAAGLPPAVAAYQAALQTDAALRQAQPGLDAEAMRQKGGLAREDAQQAGLLQREVMQQAGESSRAGMRFGLEQQRLKSELDTRGFQQRAAAQEEALRSTLMDPNASEEQRSKARQTLRALKGDADPAQWALQVTPAVKNADGSTSEGSVIRYNKFTGEVQRVDAGNGGQPPANHIKMLRANPSQAAFFDEIYGKGAAARAITAR